MQELSVIEIRTRALKANENNESWHFHIFTPTCQFNQKHEYAFIFEIKDEVYVHYSSKPENELGKDLAPLMHKADVLSEPNDSDYQLSETMKTIVDRAKELNKKGLEWHHHLISSDCNFSSNESNYTLVFEDPENGVIEQESEYEPIDDLKILEPLFYSQKR